MELEKTKEEVQQNKTKRRRIYAQLAQLQKALDNPDERVVDPEEERQKTEQERSKRIDKKLGKKQQAMTELKNWKRHQKRCLKCGSR